MTRWPAICRADMREMTWCWARSAACWAAVDWAGLPWTRWAAAARLPGALADGLAGPAADGLAGAGLVPALPGGGLALAPLAGWPPDELQPAAAMTAAPAAAAP